MNPHRPTRTRGRRPRTDTPVMLPLLLAACTTVAPVPAVTGPLAGRVVDMDGNPVAGAAVYVHQDGVWSGAVPTDDGGGFQTPEVAGSHWIRVTADGFLPRVRAASPEATALVRLSQDDGQTLRLQFGGDTMLGRRFYVGDDEEGTPPLLRPGTEVTDVVGLLEGLSPLLADAHLTGVNLESPVTLGGQPHPTKPYSYFTRPMALAGLKAAGIDFGNLANNHVYDYLEPGLGDTLESADALAFPVQGAGFTEDEAWTPLYLEVAGTTVAFVGCTSITGSQYEVGFVADDGIGKGGAAHCEMDRIGPAVAEAASRAHIVVFQVHGGFEYAQEPSEIVRTWTEEAVQAGAHIVLGHHPHRLQGLDRMDSSVVAWSLGNFLFDQDLWQTFPSALLEVHVGRDGTVRRAFLEPLLLEDYQPRGITGWTRDWIARDVAGLSAIPLALDDGAVEVDLEGRSSLEETTFPVEGPAEGWSAPQDLRDGWLAEVTGAEAWRLGRDLVGVGGFEDHDVDPDVAEGTLWTLNSADETILPDAAAQGYYGLRMTHDYANAEDLVVNLDHRVPVEPGREIGLYGWYRSDGELQVQLIWYADTEGASSSQETRSLPEAPEWTRFQVEVPVPQGAVAVAPYLRLPPPQRGQVTVDVDEVRLVEWAVEPESDVARYDMLQVRGQGQVTVERRVLPGAR